MAIASMTVLSFPNIRWRLHRLLVDMGRWVPPFSRSASRRLLLITCEGRIAQSQVFPLFHFRRQLEASFGVQLREIGLDAFEAGAPGWRPEADIVIVQPWFDVSEERLQRLLEMVYERCRPARVVFFDSFAPTDLRLGHIVEPYIELYVKKHVLRDRSLYGRPTLGETNLMDHFGRRYGLDHAPVCYPVSQALLDKLVVGPSFATADFMLEAFESNRPLSSPRQDIDLHARIETQGTDWYAAMRSEAQRAVEALPNVTCALGNGVSHSAYLNELSRSRACLSPFGYGEVAWRDYEAILCQALLMKPDCAHLEVDPDIFVPFETYVPLEWDYSDLESKLRHYLHDESERRRISTNAFERLHQYFAEHEYLTQLRGVFE